MYLFYFYFLGEVQEFLKENTLHWQRLRDEGHAFGILGPFFCFFCFLPFPFSHSERVVGLLDKKPLQNQCGGRLVEQLTMSNIDLLTSNGWWDSVTCQKWIIMIKEGLKLCKTIIPRIEMIL